MTLRAALTKLLLGLVMASPARAEVSRASCKDVDLSPKFGPIRDQTQAHWCWAFAAADFMTFYQGLGPKERVSALDFAINGLTSDPDDLFALAARFKDWPTARSAGKFGRTGLAKLKAETERAPMMSLGWDAELAIDTYQMKTGACLESRLPSEGPAPRKSKTSFLKEQLENLGDKTGQIDEAVERLAEGRSAAFEFLDNPDLLKPSPILCTSPTFADQLRDSVNAVRQANRQALADVRANADKACGARPPWKPMKLRRYDGAIGKDKISRAIALALGKGKPAMISYSAVFLKKGREAPLEPSNHVSNIVGTRWNPQTNSCEFKLRNTWGPDCEPYHESLRASCGDDGYLWLTEKDLNDRVSKAYTAEVHPPEQD